MTLHDDFDRMLLIAEYVKTGISKDANKEYVELVLKFKNIITQYDKMEIY